jgi:hypothetical protein
MAIAAADSMAIAAALAEVVQGVVGGRSGREDEVAEVGGGASMAEEGGGASTAVLARHYVVARLQHTLL